MEPGYGRVSVNEEDKQKNKVKLMFVLGNDKMKEFKLKKREDLFCHKKCIVSVSSSDISIDTIFCYYFLMNEFYKINVFEDWS